MQRNQRLFLPSSGPYTAIAFGTENAKKHRAAGSFGPSSREHQRTLAPERLGNTRRHCVSRMWGKSGNVLSLLSLFLMSGVRG
jgi:hypothetical protein